MRFGRHGGRRRHHGALALLLLGSAAPCAEAKSGPRTEAANKRLRHQAPSNRTTADAGARRATDDCHPRFIFDSEGTTSPASMGLYLRLEESSDEHDGWPVYEKLGGGAYLFYWKEFHQWRIGKDNSKPDALITSATLTSEDCPDKVRHWYDRRSDNTRWERVNDMRLESSDEPVPAAEEPEEEPEEPDEDLQVGASSAGEGKDYGKAMPGPKSKPKPKDESWLLWVLLPLIAVCACGTVVVAKGINSNKGGRKSERLAREGLGQVVAAKERPKADDQFAGTPFTMSMAPMQADGDL